MKKEIKIPEIAENVDSGLIAGILVSEGDEVKKDQPVVEVETDKASTDIPSPYDGTVEEITVKEGDEVSVNQVIMIIEVAGGEGDDEETKESEDKETEGKKESGDDDEEGDDKETKESEDKEIEGKKESGDDDDEEMKESEDKDSREEEPDHDNDEEKDTSATAGKAAEEKEMKEPEEPEEEDEDTVGEDIPASPAVRRVAREAGVNLAKIEGSGRRNRITMDDVESAKKRSKKRDQKSGKKSTEGKEKKTDLPDFSKWGDVKKEKMNTVRRITARSMTESWQQIPQVTQFDEADITAIEKFRKKHKEAYAEKGGKLTITAILVKIAAFALQKFPRFNSSIDNSDNSLLMKQYFNIGVAVDTDKGLIVPVVKDVDKKSLQEISTQTVELAKQARGSEISPDDMQGGNFTISNLGGIGGTAFTPIVYQPQVAILGVARASYKQVYRDDKFRKRLILPLSLTYDHRVINGAEGARFLRWICDVLEDPYALLQ